MTTLPVEGTLVKCSRGCGRVMLIEQVLCGVSHTVGTSGTYWECLTPEQKEKAKQLYGISDEAGS